MLDVDSSTSTPSDDDLPRPPAGRRAARRPAGPPASRPSQAPTEAASAADPIAATDPSPVTPQPDVAPAAVQTVEEGAPRASRLRKAPRRTAPADASPIDEAAAAALPALDLAAQTPAAEQMATGAAPQASGAPTQAGETVERPSRSRARTTTGRRTRKSAAAEPVDLPELPAGEAPELSPEEADAALAALTRALAGESADEAPLAEDSASSEPDVAAESAEVQEALLADDELGALTEDDAADAVADPGHDQVEASEEDEDGDDEEDDAVAEQEGEDAPRRRRRRRGGRRRRRDARDDDPSAESDGDGAAIDAGPDADENKAEGAVEGEDDEESETEGDDPAAESGTRRRRRRRRRRGEGTEGDDDPDTEVVVRVREPRSGRRSAASDEVTGIEGSTRMEAKRQRRREGRQGRRRAPILSEAEFLARRESVERVMLIRQRDDYTQIGVVEDGVLAEHYVDRASSTTLIGNIYLGRVQNVLPSMEAAFIDIGRGRNAVLYAGEVDWDAFGADGSSRKMEQVFKSGQSVLVQVTKDPVGAKGARLTSHLSIPGRYIVFSPGGELSGISRKLADTERERLRGILGGLISEESSVIVRTAAEGVSEEELVRDVNRLTAQWEAISKKSKSATAPALLYAEPDATVRIVRDLFTEDFSRLVVDGNGSAEDAYDTIHAYVSHVAPHLMDRLEKWDRAERGDLFASHRIDEQIAKALERKVFLPSGGSLVIDRTEAMTVIDVNTGKFTGTGGNLEATVTSNNLEAAEEIVRQLRLRDIGGIIVIDFIDMVLPSNRDLLLRRLVECLGRDRTRHQVAEVTSLGLVQMTRKKIGTGLAEAFTQECETCKGRGYHRHEEPVDTQAPADGGDRGERRAAAKRERGGRKTTRSRKTEAAPESE